VLRNGNLAGRGARLRREADARLVPAFAGALRLNAVWTMAMIASASAIWYGVITWIAFRVGSDWGDLRAALTQYSRTAAIIGTSLLVLGVVAWLVIRRRQRTN